METTAIVLGKDATAQLEKALSGVRKKLWKVTLQPLRQIASSASELRDAATVLDDHQSEQVVLVYSHGKGVLAARSLPDILTHSKLWTSTKASARQVTGHRWESSSARYWYIKDEGNSHGLFIFCGQIEPAYLDVLRSHTIYLMNRWNSGPSDLLQLHMTLYSFVKLVEAMKLSSFEDAFVRHRLVVA